MVEDGKGEKLRIEYAADMKVDKFGSGFGRPGQKVIHDKQVD